MQRLILFVLFTGAALAQSDNPFNRPPADVDASLRARMKEYYGYLVAGQPRKAEALVAEDAKDYYYSMDKPKYMSFEIGRIDYSDNFTKAKAIVLCEQNIMMPGMTGAFKVPIPSTWKRENGKWMWWIDPATIGNSPFGKMKPGPDIPSANGAPVPLTLATMPTTADFLFKQVQLDKSEVTLKPGESATVTVSNSAPGAMSLSIPGKPGGIEVGLEKDSLQSGEKTTLTVKALEGAKSGVVNVQVNPIGQILQLQIVVK